MTAGLKLLELTREALRVAPVPMSHRELWTFAEEQGLTKKLQATGKTPWDSLSALVYVDTKENAASEFVRVGRRPVRFWLRSRQLPKGWSATGPSDEAKPVLVPQVDEPKERALLEKDLHPVLAAFARTHLDGVRVKTIRHAASTKKAFGEWVHPDILGVRFPQSTLDERVTVEFAGAIRAPLLRMFSFELKRSVDFANLRESFFQAVSNSSWAHEGYLVAANWLDDEEFSDELARLCQSFRIGAIYLSLEDWGDSRIIHRAPVRDELDWIMLDKLVAMNPDVTQFLESVRIDLNASKIHEGEYDALPADLDAYIQGLARPSAKTAGKAKKP